MSLPSRISLLALLVFALAGRSAQAADDVEYFERNVRPLLAEHCFACHGAGKQQGGLRMDRPSRIARGGNRGKGIVAGKPEASLLITAVRYADNELRMPPKGKLSDAQIAMLVEWVRRGAALPPDTASNTPSASNAKWETVFAERRKHWAYQPVRAPPLPNVKNIAWAQSPIDKFILAKLEAAGLKSATSADRRTLIRRATFDLIGLPPTPSEVEAFIHDKSPKAWEHLIDRLLDSPRYGERWARHWLDLVRYAESLGHEFDFDIINAWRYRDYLIRALNADVPYRQFVIEQLAGDLLPTPRRHPTEGFNESVIGTAFWWLGESKHSPVDIRAEQADRHDNQIEVFGKAFLAQTIACARCHDHKFDPIPTRDYYSLYGYLRSSRYQQAFLDGPERIQAGVQPITALQPALRAALAKDAAALTTESLTNWLRAATPPNVLPTHPLHAWSQLARVPEAQFAARRDEVLAGLKAPDSPATVVFDITKEGLDSWRASGAAFGPPTRGGEVMVGGDGKFALALPGAAHSGVTASHLQGTLRSPNFDLSKRYLHLLVSGKGGRVNLVIEGFTLIRGPICDPLSKSVNAESPVWITMDLALWPERRAYLELSDSTTPNNADFLPATPRDGFIALHEVRLSDTVTTPGVPSRWLETTLTRAQTAAQLDQLVGSRLGKAISAWEAGEALDRDPAAALNWLLAAGGWKTDSAVSVSSKMRELDAALPDPLRAPALCDGPGEDEVVFLRGNHKTPGDVAPRQLMGVLCGPQSAAPTQSSGRLELAQRLVAPGNPLFARVIVNRLWKHHFGAGIVASADDFGRMGQAPTHPELLDFLADQFLQRGTSLKQMHKFMLMTATYKQSSTPSVSAAQRDPQNRLWHHVPVRRLEAEAVRDAILSVSGRLDPTPFGPSVPTYLTEFMEGRGRPAASGPLDGSGRRSIYLAVRRNFLNPFFQAFDFPTPFTSQGRRAVSNVPAQALALMNNPFVLQQSQLWARRVAEATGHSREQRIVTMYETAFARLPAADELREGLAFLDAQSQRHGCTPDDVKVWTDFAHVLMNVKEFIFIR